MKYVIVFILIIGLSLKVSCQNAYTYDNSNSITNHKRYGNDIHYVYDKLGNRLSKTVTVFAPKALTATAITATGFTANWEALDGATAYILEVANDNQFTDIIPAYKQLNVGNVLTYPITGLSANFTYYYRLRAIWSGGVSQNSNKITVTTNKFNPPPKTTAKDAVAISTTGFTAQWDAVTGAIGYYLDVSTSSDFSSFLPEFENKDVGNVLSFTISGLSSGIPYYFRLRSYSDNGVSEYSNTISANTLTLQNIALAAGWNIISANVTPTNTELKAIFHPLIDAGRLKKVMDETGKTIENFGAFGGWKNNIGNLNSAKGYKVNVIAASSLSIEGTPVALPFDIALATGWNIISFPAATAQDAKAIVQALIDAGKLKKVMDEAGKTIENFGAFGGWKNNIGNFLPGKGYKVNVTGNCTLTIPATATKAAILVPEVLASTHFAKSYSGNGTDHMTIHLVNLQKSGLTEGDEIGVFDGKLCVGSATIGADLLLAGSISIPASANDGLGESSNGFTSGDPVRLHLFRAGKTYPLNLEKVGGTDSFDKNESLFAQVNLNNLTGIQSSDNYALFKCFPNPFTQEITIELRYEKPTEITVEIYSTTGQRIKTLFKGMNEGNLILKWNGNSDSGEKVAPGVYLCKVNGMSKQVVFNGEGYK